MTLEQLKAIKQTDLYKKLDAAVPSKEGNLFSDESECGLSGLTALEGFLRREFGSVGRHFSGIRCVETGTNKCMFGYFLNQTVIVKWYQTYGIDPNSAIAFHWFHRMYAGSCFTLGDSRETFFADDLVGFDLAWIDGGHTRDVAFSDIQVAMDAGIPVILVDDMVNQDQVRPAFESCKREGWEFSTIHPEIGLIRKVK